MKKLIFFFVFLYSVQISAQNSRVEIPYFEYFTEFDEGICENYIILTAYFTDGTSIDFHDAAYGEGTFGTGANAAIRPNFFYDFPGKIITGIRVHAFSREEQDVFLGNGCRSDRGTTIQHEEFYNLDNQSCISDNHYVREVNDGEREVEHILNLNFEISTTIEVIQDPLATQLGYEDDFTVNATAGFSATSYNWQYQVVDNLFQINNNNWVSLSRPINPNSLVFKASDFLPASDVGRTIVFRIQPCFDHPQGSIAEYKILKSAPHIISLNPPTTTPVSCFGAADGTITLEFDRALDPGEVLGFEIVDLSNQINTGSSDPPLYESIRPVEISAANMLGTTITITGLPGSNPEGFRAEFLGGTTIYADGVDHAIEFDIYEPNFIQFNVTNSTNINCNAGEDGTISIEASGGTNENYQYQLTHPDGTSDNWVNFDNTFTHVITGLRAGEYIVKLRDGNDCRVYEVSDVDNDGVLDIGSVELTETIVLEEPANPLAIEFLPVTVDRATNSNNATGNGFTDGRIIGLISGGTGPYTIEWKNTEGTVITSFTTTPFNTTEISQTTTLDNIGAGTYTLTVKDANHSTQATQVNSCLVEDIFAITEPEELKLTIEETNPVSCNSANAFNNPIGDGQLVAHATGGIQLGSFDNNGLPYYYTWKKEDENGVFQDLIEEKDSIISNLTASRYAVNIRDANGVIIGDYINNSLVNANDVIHDLLDPSPIVITFTKQDLQCSNDNNGWAEALINGGAGNYIVNWSNGETTPRIENLELGTYLLFVTDEKGCQATAQVVIEAPNPLEISVIEQKNPVCNDGSDGVISLEITGGLEGYNYSWLKDGEIMNNQNGFYSNNLFAGVYTITVTDTNLCSETVVITLENPSPDLINLGEDRLLCGGQSVILNASYQGEGTSYLWTSDNGFTSTSPVIEISDAGTYTVAVTTALGCGGGDSIQITTSDTPIDAHFVLSTQAFAGEELALVNISEPLGERVEWFFPPEAVVIAETNENAILLFKEPGSYEIILRSNQGTCFLDYMKTILIEESENIADIGDAEIPFIQEFVIYPNPTSGEFKVSIVLSEASPISLKMFSIAANDLVHKRLENAADSFEIDYYVSLASGTYILLLETAKGSEIRKIIIR